MKGGSFVLVFVGRVDDRSMKLSSGYFEISERVRVEMIAIKGVDTELTRTLSMPHIWEFFLRCHFLGAVGRLSELT